MLIKILSILPAILEVFKRPNKTGLEKASAKRDKLLIRGYKKALKEHWRELKKLHKGDSVALMEAAKELLKEDPFNVEKQ